MKSKIFTLKNKSGMTMKVSNLGGIVTELTVPDRDGVFEDVLLGCKKLEDNHSNGYMSAIIGRVCGRIGKGKFTLDGKVYDLAKNVEKDGVASAIHGGAEGFDSKIWDAREFTSPDGPALELTYLSPDGESGFPGNLFVRVVYTLMECNAWRIEYWAMTDAPTVVNLTNHAYFNLNGGKSDVLDHLVQIFSSSFLPTNPGLVPTGKVLPVEGTPIDFNAPRRIGEHIGSKSKIIVNAGGFDHCYMIDRSGPGLALAAIAEDEESGRQMEVWTTEPCLQFYSANSLKAGINGKGGVPYPPRYGLCFETQHAPDAPNNVGFQSIRLDPGKVMQSTTIYQFYTV